MKKDRNGSGKKTGNTGSSVRQYAAGRIWELALCVLTAFAAVGIELNGFYIDSARQGNYILIAVTAAAVMLLCFTGAYSRKSAAIAGTAAVILILAGIAVIQIRTPVSTVFRDEEGNPWLFFLIIVLTSLVVFFLCRTVTGTGILFIAGAFLTGALQFLYSTVNIYMMLMFICGAGALYIYKNYQRSVLRTETVRTAFTGVFAISAAVCIIIMLLAAGIFYGIVRPLDPPQRELKLITSYKALEVLEKAGIADMQDIYDSDELTDQINDNKEDSRQKGDRQDNSEGDIHQQVDDRQKDQRRDPGELDDSSNPLLYPVKYAYNIYGPFVLAGLLILIIILAVLTKLWLRRRWLGRVMKKTPEQQIILMYGFYIKRFRKMKIPKRASETPYEFCQRERSGLRLFRAGDISFEDITDIYVRAKYGRQPVSGEDRQRYLTFHREFFRNCRKYLGKLKYIIKFFIL